MEKIAIGMYDYCSIFVVSETIVGLYFQQGFECEYACKKSHCKAENHFFF